MEIQINEPWLDKTLHVLCCKVYSVNRGTTSLLFHLFLVPRLCLATSVGWVERLLPKSSHCLESAFWDNHRGYLGFDFHWHVSGTGCPSAQLQSFQRGSELLLPGVVRHVSTMSEPLWTSERCSWQCRWGNNTWRSWPVVLGPESSQTGQKDPSSYDKKSPGTKASP